MVGLSSLATPAVLLLGAISAVSAEPDTVNWGRWQDIRYGVGIEWGNEAEVGTHISNACYGWDGHRGYYQDVYYKPWKESPYSNKLCVNMAGGHHINFEIANLNPNVGFTLANKDCDYWFRYIRDWGRSGGEVQTNGWWYRLDPNSGKC